MPYPYNSVRPDPKHVKQITDLHLKMTKAKDAYENARALYAEKAVQLIEEGQLTLTEVARASGISRQAVDQIVRRRKDSSETKK